jgi:tol-pal system protein YbgF
MKKGHIFSFRLLAAAVLAVALFPVPAHATSKEIIELQTQVQQLLDMVQRLQSTMDARVGVLQHLAEQTADNANRVTATVNAMQQKLNAQADATNGKTDSISGQVQSLNDSVDELKSRIAKLDKAIQDMRTELQNNQNPAPGETPAVPTPAVPANPAPTPTGAAHPPSGQTALPAPATATVTHLGAAPSGETAPPVSGPAPAEPVAPAVVQAPPLQETYQAGVRDLNAARYELAAGEFEDVLHYYPLDDLAGTAQFYLGEIAYRQLHYSEAIKAFNAVLESFPGSAKAPAAKLRKGLAMMELNERTAGILQLKQLIQRYPQSPEANQAKRKLEGMGIKVAATR